MTPEEIQHIEDSFAKVVPNRALAAALFYGRLFEIEPDLRPLFKDDMTEQGAKLMQMLSDVVGSLRNLEAVMPALQDLARRHVGYGVQPEHYEPVGAALFWTLEQGLGEAFTEDVEAAWKKAYGVLAGSMIAAAYPGSGAAD